MSKKAIDTTNAPKAIGPYSQAVKAGELLFLSGQIPLDPATGILVSGGIEEQAKQVFRNIQGILAEGGFVVEEVVKTTVFLKDLKDFDAVNRLYADFFAAPFPARACVEVAALPKGALVEIEAIAVKGTLDR
jgi:2-iminobutanoate/2-iminopropanoate deaminase